MLLRAVSKLPRGNLVYTCRAGSSQACTTKAKEHTQNIRRCDLHAASTRVVRLQSMSLQSSQQIHISQTGADSDNCRLAHQTHLMQAAYSVPEMAVLPVARNNKQHLTRSSMLRKQHAAQTAGTRRTHQLHVTCTAADAHTLTSQLTDPTTPQGPKPTYPASSNRAVQPNTLNSNCNTTLLMV